MLCNKYLHVQQLQLSIKFIRPLFNSVQPALQLGNPGGITSVIAPRRCVATRARGLLKSGPEQLRGARHLSRDIC
jgi:hypothetical protein